MKKIATIGVALAALAALAGCERQEQASSSGERSAAFSTGRAVPEYNPRWYPKEFPAVNAPEIPFQADTKFFDLPLPLHFGEIVDAATDSQGHVYILSRGEVNGNISGGSATQLFEFDANGRFLRELGRNIYSFGYAHSVQVDADDNPWVVDKGTDMVTKFDKNTGKVLMVLGRREEMNAHYWAEEGPEDRNASPVGRLGEPAGIAWDSQGNIYVADGYIHSRVAKFDKNGKWLGSWGKFGTGPGEFDTVHGIQVDSKDRVWVADRTNGRLQVFDTNGKFLKEVIVHVPTPAVQPQLQHQFPSGADVFEARGTESLHFRPGTPAAFCITRDGSDRIFVGDGYPGRIYKLDIEGKPLGWFGHGVGKNPGYTGATHGIACPNENLIYTAEFQNWVVQRWVLNPNGPTTPATETPGPSRAPGS